MAPMNASSRSRLRAVHSASSCAASDLPSPGRHGDHGAGRGPLGPSLVDSDANGLRVNTRGRRLAGTMRSAISATFFPFNPRVCTARSAGPGMGGSESAHLAASRPARRAASRRTASFAACVANPRLGCRRERVGEGGASAVSQSKRRC